jgi:hypothetical protein
MYEVADRGRASKTKLLITALLWIQKNKYHVKSDNTIVDINVLAMVLTLYWRMSHTRCSHCFRITPNQNNRMDQTYKRSTQVQFSKM